jgi:predicted Zn-dependent protease
VSEYVNRVGQNIVRNSDAKVPFTIKDVESLEVNAFALPGGFLYVNTGLLLAADQEAEFTRSQEAEAEYLGAQYMYKAEYDPSALLSFFENFRQKKSRSPEPCRCFLAIILRRAPASQQLSTKSRRSCRLANSMSFEFGIRHGQSQAGVA